MRVGYLECFAGVSGDMMLGALIDAGVSRELLERAAQSMGLGAQLRFTRVDRSGISATKVDVLVDGHLAESSPAHDHSHAHPHEQEPAHPHQHEHPHEDGPELISEHSYSHTHADEAHSHEHSHPLAHADEHQHPYEHEESGAPSIAPSAMGGYAKHPHSHADDPHELVGELVHDNGHTHAHSHDEHSHQHEHGRSLSEIRRLIQHAAIAEDAKSLALRTFELLGASEAKIHNIPVESIHFHEVGSVDAIIDIVCSAVGLCSLGVDRWVCSPLNVGGGFVECAHGKFPVPAPATADVLRGAPTYSSGIQMELVTPTGAALVRALGCDFSEAPPMRVASIGYGAGTRDPKRFPNVLRLSLGEPDSSLPREAGNRIASSLSHSSPFASETIAVLECAVDDMNPQILAHCTQLALDHGALDVMSTPVTMKKGRLGTLITLLCRCERADEFEALLFRETSTLGIRVRQEERIYLDRKLIEVETPYGTVPMKVASSRGDRYHAQPEFEDCRRLAAAAGVPLKEVMEAALLAFAHSRETNEVQA